jgi:hypothetical protein
VTRDEIERYANLSRSRCAKVDVSLSAEYDGYVRSVAICAGNEVRVDFEQYGYDEGGFYFHARFDSLDGAIRAVEEFLGTAHTEWRNYSATGDYPEPMEHADARQGYRKLEAAAASGTVILPPGRFSRRGAEPDSVRG